MNTYQMALRAKEIKELKASVPDPEKLKKAHKEFLKWREDKKAGKLPAWEWRGR